MTRQKSSSSMTVLAVLFGLALIVQFGKVPALLAEDEMDEELRSTISSDPVNRGRRRSAPTAPTQSATPSSSGGGENEEGEWRTMRSETHRSWSGAPSSIQIDLTKNRIFTPKIGFAANSDVPTPQSTTILKRVAATLVKRPDLAVRIEGHTDSIGYDQPNLELSQRRADHVRDILVQNGVTASQLQSVGKGDRFPVASSTTSDGQEKNRRVEFHISGAAAAPASTPVAAAPAPAAATPQPIAPAPVAPAPPPQQAAPTPSAAPAPAAIPIAAAPPPQPVAPVPATAVPAPAPGLVAPPQPAPAAPPPAPFGVLPQ